MTFALGPPKDLVPSHAWWLSCGGMLLAYHHYEVWHSKMSTLGFKKKKIFFFFPSTELQTTGAPAPCGAAALCEIDLSLRLQDGFRVFFSSQVQPSGVPTPAWGCCLP